MRDSVLIRTCGPVSLVQRYKIGSQLRELWMRGSLAHFEQLLQNYQPQLAKHNSSSGQLERALFGNEDSCEVNIISRHHHLITANSVRDTIELNYNKRL